MWTSLVIPKESMQRWAANARSLDSARDLLGALALLPLLSFALIPGVLFQDPRA